MATVIEGPAHITEGLTCDAFTPPANSVGNNSVNPADPITTNRLKHIHMVPGGQMDGGDPYQEIRPVYIALTVGKVQQFQCGLAVAVTGDSEVIVDLYKNGVSILSAIPTLNTTFTPDDYDQVVAGIDPALDDYVPGDVFEVVVTVTPGTGTPGERLFWQVCFNENQF